MKASVTGLLLLATAAINAAVIQNDIFISGTDGYHTYRIPAIITAPDNSLLAFCEGRKNGGGDAGDIDLLMKRSTDNGKSWSRQFVIWSDGENTCGNPCPVVDKDTGTIFLASTWNRGDYHEKNILADKNWDGRKVFIFQSRDNGKSWSGPTEITAQAKAPDWYWYATGPGVGIQISSGQYKGRLIIPCDHSFAEVMPDVKYGSHIIYSDDHGATWKTSDYIMPGFNENQVVELSDGRLLMNARNHRYRGTRCLAFSSDGGQTWPDVRYQSNLIEPRCQASILRYDASAKYKSPILFSNPNHESKRLNMTVKASFDEAATWPVEKIIYEGPSAYSCLTVLPGGQIGCFYERGDKSPYEKITLATLPLDELTNDAAVAFAWDVLAELPPADGQDEALGVAGAFAGFSNGALIAAGGANFAKPYWGMDKQWHSDIWVLEKDGGSSKWHTGFNLRQPMGYGMSVTTEAGVVCIGGADAQKCYREVFILTWDKTAKTINTLPLPSLPIPCGFGGAAMIDGVIYAAGGMSGTSLSSAMNNLWGLDLSAKNMTWQMLAPIPALPRAFNVTVAQNNGAEQCLYVIGGRTQLNAADASSVKFLSDVYRYRPSSKQWDRCADMPKAICAGVAAAVGDNHIAMFGGADDTLFFKADEIKDAHPGFPKDIYAYNTITDKWINAGQVPQCQVTSAAVSFEGGYLIVSGELRPRVRTPQILHGTLITK